MGEGLPEEERLIPLGKLLDLAAVLDTPERASAFRAYARQVAAESPALWHAGPRGLVRLTHQAAMARTAPLLRARPAYAGDVAYVDGPRVTLSKRLALAAFVGDGHTTTVLGRDGRAALDVTVARPHKMLASEPWIAAACDGRGPRWPARARPPLGGPPRAGRARGRLRFVEVGSRGAGRHRPRSRRGGRDPRDPGEGRRRDG